MLNDLVNIHTAFSTRKWLCANDVTVSWVAVSLSRRQSNRTSVALAESEGKSSAPSNNSRSLGSSADSVGINSC